MYHKFGIRIGALSFLVALTILLTLWNPVAFAADQPEGLQTSESDTSGVIDGGAFVMESDETPNTETTPVYDNGILLQWDVDSSLTYELDADNYVWKVYDEADQELTNGSGTPVKAGYALTGYGTWFGSATVRVTIVNTMDVEAELRLLFCNHLAQASLEIIGTLETSSGDVSYEPAGGVLVIQPNSEGVVSMTITAEALQKVNAYITEEDTVTGWIQVQVISPVQPPAETTEPETEAATETTEPETEATTEATEPETEATTETTEPETEATTEATEPETEDTAETTDPTSEATTETTEPETEVTTEPSTAPSTEEQPSE